MFPALSQLSGKLPPSAQTAAPEPQGGAICTTCRFPDISRSNFSKLEPNFCSGFDFGATNKKKNQLHHLYHRPYERPRRRALRPLLGLGGVSCPRCVGSPCWGLAQPTTHRPRGCSSGTAVPPQASGGRHRHRCCSRPSVHPGSLSRCPPKVHHATVGMFCFERRRGDCSTAGRKGLFVVATLLLCKPASPTPPPLSSSSFSSSFLPHCHLRGIFHGTAA